MRQSMYIIHFNRFVTAIICLLGFSSVDAFSGVGRRGTRSSAASPSSLLSTKTTKPASSVLPTQTANPPHTAFTLMWEVHNQQEFYSRLGYTYDYYLDGGKNPKELDKNILEILEKAKPAIKAKYEEFKMMSDNEVKAMDKMEQAMYKNINFMKLIINLEEKWEGGDQNYLKAYHNEDEENQCVWGLWRDDSAKRIQIFLRGTETSRTTKDIGRDLQGFLSDMPLPPVLIDIIEENAEINMESPLVDKNGKAVESVPVHQGFYEYVFNNKSIDDGSGKPQQPIDLIMKQIEEIDSNPAYKNYEIWVCGHSLGAAMATLLTFHLAGQRFENIRKPVKSATFSSPLTGCKEFRAAFQTMEKEGLIQYLRVVNQEDFVPGGWPFSFSFPPKGYKHVGMNLELSDKEFKYTYPTKKNKFERVGQTSILRKLVFMLKNKKGGIMDYILSHHGEERISDRMVGISDRMIGMENKEDIKMASEIEDIKYDKTNAFPHLTLDDLYNDASLHDDFPFALKTKRDSNY